MAEITASMVKDLRELTGLGMMECKKALAETNGDMKAAEDLLRIKSGAKAGKAASRVAAEGVVAAFTSADGKTGALVEVNCETDFVAKNEDFLAFAKNLAQLVADTNPADTAALSDAKIGGTSVEDVRKGLVMKLGENMTVRRFARFQTAGKLASYLHGSKIGVMVDYEGGDDQLGKDIAMHIAAANPPYLSRETVPADAVSRERAFYEDQAKQTGKPANVISKIVDGKMEKFYGDNCLLEQIFIKDPDGKQKVKNILKTATVKRFTRLQLGEGIEKKKADFAEEVAAQLKQ